MLRQPIATGESQIRELGSRFFGYTYPVDNQELAEVLLDQLWKRFPDATHICYAWRFGTQGEDVRAADDGEPKYSSGMPILNQIRSAGLTNVLVAVVRYYGGTKLGVPGLIKAYGGAAAEALEGIATVEALEAFAHSFAVAASKAGIVYDLARKGGATATMVEMLEDGSQVIQVTGFGDATELLARINGRLVG